MPRKAILAKMKWDKEHWLLQGLSGSVMELHVAVTGCTWQPSNKHHIHDPVIAKDPLTQCFHFSKSDILK